MNMKKDDKSKAMPQKGGACATAVPAKDSKKPESKPQQPAKKK